MTTLWLSVLRLLAVIILSVVTLSPYDVQRELIYTFTEFAIRAEDDLGKA
jgi:hypothetical protein